MTNKSIINFPTNIENNDFHSSKELEAMKLATRLYIELHDNEDKKLNSDNMFNKISEYYHHFLQIFRKQDTAALLPTHNDEEIIKQTVFENYIICLEDGMKLKTLKRHLKKYGLTIEKYKKKWNLPHNYPSVCPAYSKRRGDIAVSTTASRVEKMLKLKKKVS